MSIENDRDSELEDEVSVLRGSVDESRTLNRKVDQNIDFRQSVDIGVMWLFSSSTFDLPPKN